MNEKSFHLQGLNHCLSLRWFSSKEIPLELRLSCQSSAIMLSICSSKILCRDALVLPLYINHFAYLNLKCITEKQEECKFSVNSLSSSKT